MSAVMTKQKLCQHRALRAPILEITCLGGQCRPQEGKYSCICKAKVPWILQGEEGHMCLKKFHVSIGERWNCSHFSSLAAGFVLVLDFPLPLPFEVPLVIPNVIWSWCAKWTLSLAVRLQRTPHL